MTKKVARYECDRCKAVDYAEIRREAVRDGGFTGFELPDTPKGWDRVTKLSMDLCPACFDMYKVISAKHSREWNEFKKGDV